MDNGCLVVRKWQVEPSKIERRRWNRRRTTALQILTNEGNAQIDFRGDWSKIFPDTYKFADYNNFWWTRYKYFW